MLFAIGIGILYLVFTLPEMGNYPLVRIATGLFGGFSLISGSGILARRAWTKWTLLMLLFSMYSVFGATHLATGETSDFILGFVLIGLPLTAIIFWRSVKKVLYDAT